jgi:hypothetical protein
LSRKRNGNNGTFAERFGLETINDVCDLGLHLSCCDLHVS